MNNAASSLFRLFALLSLLFIAEIGFSHHTVYSTYRNGTRIYGEQTLADEFYLQTSPARTELGTRAKVRLHYTEQLLKYYTSDWAFKIRFDIDRWDAAGNFLGTLNGIELGLTYASASGSTATYIDEQVYTFTGASRYKVRNVNILTQSGALNGQPIPADIFLTLELEVERCFDLDPDVAPVAAHRMLDNEGLQAEIYWPYVLGAEEYELEWYFSCEECSDRPTQPSDIADNDYTRVTLSQNFYTLNLVYDKGTLFYRVRHVGRQGSNLSHRLEGLWSNSLSNQIAVENREPSKNWTYQAVFAEEGKVKEVLSFFDGSGRNRQSITRNNSDQVALVGEQFYDYEGRAALQTLPSPSSLYSTHLKFYEAFSLNSNQTALLKADFDPDASECAQEDLTLGNEEGAAHYYSELNTFTEGFYAYLPESWGYPYTRTAYGRDGRVKAQSGVGITHKLGGDHETEYFYAAPAQEKLDRLFGNEVGYAHHYRVNAVKDANGQLSLSYQDLSGKTIATSLSGPSPESLDRLASNLAPAPMQLSFANVNAWVPSEKAYRVHTNFLVEAPGLHTFRYEMTAAEYEALCGIAGGDCTYDLLISLFDDCNEAIYEDGRSENNPQYLHLTQVINVNSMPLELEMKVTFSEAGVYTLHKTLSLNQAAMDAAVENFRQSLPGNCFNIDDIIESYQDAIDWTACANCADYCTLYPEACEEDECAPQAVAKCHILLAQLKQDLSPGGQYFDNLTAGSAASPNDGWLHTYVTSRTNTSWFNTQFGSGIDNWNDVRANWEPAWVDVYVNAHPEYCHYSVCETLKASQQWDLDMMGIDTYNGAQAAGFLPAGFSLSCGNFVIGVNTAYPMDRPSAPDPFFASYATNGQRTNAFNALTQSGCLWQNATSIVTSSGCTSGCEDEAWRIFRGLYLGAKHTLIDEYKVSLNCHYICDISLPPDLVADVDCGNSEEKTNGFYIRVPDATSLITHIANPAFGTQLDTLMEPCSGSYAWFLFDVTLINCQEQCTDAELMINGVQVAPSINFNAAPWSEYCTDPVLLAEKVAEAINSFPSVPDYTAVAQGTLVEIRSPYGSLYNGYIIGGRCGVEGPIGPIGMLDGGADKPDTCAIYSDCFCTDLKQQLELMMLQEEVNFATACSLLAAIYNDAFGLSFVTTSTVENWYAQCEKGEPFSPAIPWVLNRNCSNEPIACEEDPQATELAYYAAEQHYRYLIDMKVSEFIAQYENQCMQRTTLQERFTVEFIDHEYHFTLYYYDQAGNLTRTVPPEGVAVLNSGGIADTEAYRAAPDAHDFIRPLHSFVSGYRYNTLNQVTAQYMPDASKLTESGHTSHFLGLGNVTDVSLSSTGTGVTVSNNALRFTSNSGQSWTMYSLPGGFSPQSVSVIDADRGFVAGNTGSDGVVWYYDLRESSPFLSAYTSIGKPLFEVVTLEAGATPKAAAAGNNGALILLEYDGSTLNGTASTATSTADFRALGKAPGGKIYAAGQNGSTGKVFAYSIDDIDNPTDLNFNVNPAQLNAIEVLSSTTVIVGGTDGTDVLLYKAENVLSTPVWSVNLLPSVSSTVTDVAFVSPLRGYASLIEYNGPFNGTGSLYATLDGGDTWYDNSMGDAVYSAIAVAPSSQQVMCVGSPSGGPGSLAETFYSGSFSQLFWYDNLGRIKASADARQLMEAYFSYTVYDELGRITEAGQVRADFPTAAQLNNDFWPTVWVGSTEREQVSYTQYDEPLSNDANDLFAEGQQYLRNRVASTYYKELSTDTTYRFASHYSYDVHGNVNELVQENKKLEEFGQSVKRMQYEYDLVSGNVHRVIYQPGQYDEFYHQYLYDADNRLTHVQTSKDSLIWDMDAKYFYYLHGPLGRTEIGEKKVQGLDYAYTLQGWIKGVNSNLLEPDLDMGKDGVNIGNEPDYPYFSNHWEIHNMVARDAFGYSIGYYDNDYNAIRPYGQYFLNDIANLNAGSPGKELFNGNIRHTALALRKLDHTPLELTAYLYEYDQLNRIKSMEAWATTSGYGNATTGHNYKEQYSYDANGNILTLLRNGYGGSPAMDDFSYHYINGTNKLDYVSDAVSGNPFGIDLKSGQTTRNYRYDPMGNLVQDVAEEIDLIEWDVRGKVRKVIRTTGSTKDDLEFRYDALGQRVIKIVKPKESNGDLKSEKDWKYTFYTRDAQGNVMAIEEMTFAQPFGGGQEDFVALLKLSDQTIYGSARIGNLGLDMEKQIPFTAEMDLDPTTGETLFGLKGDIEIPDYTASRIHNGEAQRMTGLRTYELTTPLQHVISTVSDRAIPQEISSSGNVSFYQADIKSYSDYYPFGMQMPGRFETAAGHNYRYGISGMEKDDELKGTGNSYDFGARMYDPRIGRWWSIDPLRNKYAGLSPYNYAANIPTSRIDVGGKDHYWYIEVKVQGVKEPMLVKLTVDDANMISVNYATVTLNESMTEITDGRVLFFFGNDMGYIMENIWGWKDDRRSFEFNGVSIWGNASQDWARKGKSDVTIDLNSGVWSLMLSRFKKVAERKVLRPEVEYKKSEDAGKIIDAAQTEEIPEKTEKTTPTPGEKTVSYPQRLLNMELFSVEKDSTVWPIYNHDGSVDSYRKGDKGGWHSPSGTSREITKEEYEEELQPKSVNQADE